MNNLGLRRDEYLKLVDSHPSLMGWLEQNQRAWSNDKLDAKFGHFARWRSLLDSLPAIDNDRFDLTESVVIGGGEDFGQKERDIYMALHPWRKGPFQVRGLDIDSEWRCNMKWDRFSQKLGSLSGRSVLDVGGGNGYFSLRLCGRKAELVVCLEPMGLYWAQHMSLRKYIAGIPLVFVPMNLEQFAAAMQFDVVLSMGVIYHSRHPGGHLQRLNQLLCPGGLLLLESLVAPTAHGTMNFLPGQRYAMMRNVWHIPVVDELKASLVRAGFSRVRLLDLSTTSRDEQRSTSWMRFHSLSNFLDADDRSLTVEGKPAPRRAIIEAHKDSLS